MTSACHACLWCKLARDFSLGHRLQVALYQPDIPQNAGTIIRLCACLDIPVSIVHPAGFDVSDRGFKRARLDYVLPAPIRHYETFDSLQRSCAGIGSRLILLTTRSKVAYHSFEFHANDTLMAGRESAGVPDEVHRAVDLSVYIPMRDGARSLNVAVALAMVLGEALKQTGGFSRFA